MGKHSTGAPWRETRALSLAREPGEHTDPGLAGFGMRVSPKLKAVWTVKCSIGSGKERKHHEATLGNVAKAGEKPDETTTLSLKQARENAQKWLDEKRLPAVVREQRARRANKTIANTLEEFLEHRRLRRKGHGLAESTKDYYREIYKYYLQECKDWPLVEMQYSSREWLRIFEQAQQKSVARSNGAMTLVSGIYNFLEMNDDVDMNPIRKARGQQRIRKPEPRTSHVETLDLPRFVKQAATLRNKHSRDATRLFMLTGMRRLAVLAMKWSAIDFDAQTLAVGLDDPGWKRWDGKIYPLNDEAMVILRRRFDERGSSDYVFPARHGGGAHMVDIRTAIAQASEGCSTVATAHILRRTFATMANIVFPGDVVLAGSLLAHKWALPKMAEAAITIKYTIATARARAASNRIADVILQIGGERPLTEATIALLDNAAIDVSAFKVAVIPEDEDDAEGLLSSEPAPAAEEMTAQ